MRSVSLLSVGLLLSVLTATAAFAYPEQSQLLGQIQPQTEDARVKGNPRHDPNNDANGPRSSEPRTDATPDASTSNAEHSKSATPTQAKDTMAPSKGKAAAKPVCPDNNMPMTLAERPATSYQDKGVRSSEPGKSIPQLKEEHHEMRDQMQANADCVPRKK